MGWPSWPVGKTVGRAQFMEWSSMNKEVTICLRIDEATARRIENILNSDCPTRSRYTRAIERALSPEEGRARLQSAHSAIDWG